MIDSEKREFAAIMQTTADLYGRDLPNKRIVIYWNALLHRELSDVKDAINRHIQNAERGRFFPLPADISAQLPSEADVWLTADEAWATLPKNEFESAAMCDEMAAALNIAQDLINMGDMIAARRAFIDHYNRLTEQGKREGKKPNWWASYGFDKDGRHKATTQVVERNNLALPPGQRIQLPTLNENENKGFANLLNAPNMPAQTAESIKKLGDDL